MSVKFEMYQGTTAELTELGTVKEIAGKKGKISFIRKNFNDATKRVAVVLTNANGESALISCSKQVSDALRSKQMNIAQLASCKVLENEDGINFISMPGTGGLRSIELDGVRLEVVEVSNEFLPEELIAF
jgi:hypothetical protein